MKVKLLDLKKRGKNKTFPLLKVNSVNHKFYKNWVQIFSNFVLYVNCAIYELQHKKHSILALDTNKVEIVVLGVS